VRDGGEFEEKDGLEGREGVRTGQESVKKESGKMADNLSKACRNGNIYLPPLAIDVGRGGTTQRRISAVAPQQQPTVRDKQNVPT
jgi:hypothetical protein